MLLKLEPYGPHTPQFWRSSGCCARLQQAQSCGVSPGPPDRHNRPMTAPVLFRWLGVAGIELRAGDHTLVVDPFFTRPSFLRLWFGRVAPDRTLIAEQISRCNAVLITHAHYDHLMDAPEIARNTGATVYGSPNTCRLLALCGIPQAQIRLVTPGDHLEFGPFTVDVLPGMHGVAPGFEPGPLRPGLHPPLRLRDYRMDTTYAFLVQVAGQRALIGAGLPPERMPVADVLFMIAVYLQEWIGPLLAAIRPRLVFPVHWDDMFRPLDRPLRPSFTLPRWAWPPLQRADPARLTASITQVAPDTAVLVPEVLKEYELGIF